MRKTKVLAFTAVIALLISLLPLNVFAIAPSAISVVLLGNKGTAIVSNSYSESEGLVWEENIVNGNKVGTDTISFIHQEPFNDTNLKAGYWVVANEGYYIDAFYRSQEDYDNHLSSLPHLDLTDKSLYVFDNKGYLIKGVITELTFPGDTFYISFAAIPETTDIEDTDDNSGIMLEATTNVLPYNATLSVTAITSGASFNSVNTILGDSVNGIVAYDISLLSYDAEVQPSGLVKIYLPIPAGFDLNRLTVYYINTKNNTKEAYVIKIETIAGKKYAVFETNHFSTYALAEKAVQDNPQTGDQSNIAMWILLTFLSGGVVFTILLLRRKHKGTDNKLNKLFFIS